MAMPQDIAPAAIGVVWRQDTLRGRHAEVRSLEAPTTASTTYTVVSGDSLWGIARKNGTSVEAIQSANGLSSTTIRIGQQLNIPSN